MYFFWCRTREDLVEKSSLQRSQWWTLIPKWELWWSKVVGYYSAHFKCKTRRTLEIPLRSEPLWAQRTAESWRSNPPLLSGSKLLGRSQSKAGSGWHGQRKWGRHESMRQLGDLRRMRTSHYWVDAYIINRKFQALQSAGSAVNNNALPGMANGVCAARAG